MTRIETTPTPAIKNNLGWRNPEFTRKISYFAAKKITNDGCSYTTEINC